jgi:valyl-tRNA synthetase
VDKLLSAFQIGEAGNRLHEFLWNEYADWYIEGAKHRLKAGDDSALPVLAKVLDMCLRLLHPFMPFVTEAAWQRLRAHIGWAETDGLIVAPWPTVEGSWVDGEAEQDFETATLDLVPRVRQALEILPRDAVKSTAVAVAPDPSLPVDDRDWITVILKDTAAANATFSSTAPWNVQLNVVPDEHGVFGTTGRVRFFVPADVKDVAAERARLSKQMGEAEGAVRRLEGKVGTVAFRERAPAPVVAREQEKLAAAHARLEALRQRLAELG